MLQNTPKTKHHPHFTAYGYLSIPKPILHELIQTQQDIEIEGVQFSWEKLQKNITYSDNAAFYRWDKADIRKCRIN